jgi:PEP-CTERM motif-containing protein
MGFRDKNVIIACAVLAASVVVPEIHASTFTGEAPGNNPGQILQASATFTVSNLELIVTLSNTATFDPNVAPDILTGIFFTIDGDPVLTPVSAEVGPGSFVIGDRLLPGFTGDIGNEWAYRGGLTKTPLGANEGISSTGLGWFGKKNLFPGKTIPKSGSLNGIQFGLTTAFDFPGNDQSNIKNQSLIENSAVFTFAGLPQNFDLTDISAVTFQYGTNVKQPEVTGIAVVPEPTTIMLVAAGMGLMALTSRRRMR